MINKVLRWMAGIAIGMSVGFVIWINRELNVAVSPF